MINQLSVFKAWVTARLNVTSERGANLVEYVFLLAFIALVVVGTVILLGNKINLKFGEAETKL